MSYTDLAKATGLSTSAVHQRVRRLEQRGVISGYAAGSTADAVGLPLTAFISVTPLDPPHRTTRPSGWPACPRSRPATRSRGRSPTSSRCGWARRGDLEDLLAGIRSAANVRTRTTVVLSTPYEARPPPSPTRSGSARQRRTSLTALGEQCARGERARSAGLRDAATAAGLGAGRRDRVARAEVAVLAPPGLAGLGQRVDRVVVDVLARQRLVVAGLDRGAVVLASSTRCRARCRRCRPGAPSACRRTARRRRCAAWRTRAGSPSSSAAGPGPRRATAASARRTGSCRTCRSSTA